MSNEDPTSLLIAIAALIASVAALWYTARTFWLKTGAEIRGSFSLCTDAACEDKYIASISLENLKDRSVVIFGIFVRLGHSYYLEVEDFETEPLILRPFEVFTKKYDPIDFYTVSSTRLNLNPLFDLKVKQRIVLSTSDGKYVVRSYIPRWSPVSDFFRNHFTAVVRPHRSTYKGKAFGGNALYVVEFKMADGKEEIVPVYAGDHNHKKFRKFRLTQSSLSSKEELESYLLEQAGLHLPSCINVTVHDIKAWRDEIYTLNAGQSATAEHMGWLVYHIVGPLHTWIDTYRVRRSNKALRAAHRRSQKGQVNRG